MWGDQSKAISNADDVEFPLIIGDKVPEDDEHWQLFLLLIRICSISLAPSTSFDLIAYLQIDYLYTFRQVYPNISLIPKQHYMIHYPSQIGRYGPLIHTWTMRQESKLSFFKRASRFSNYKNVPKTIASRHQYWLCQQVLDNPNILTPLVESSSKFTTKSVAVESDSIQCKLRSLVPHIDNEAIVTHPQWVKVQSSRLSIFVDRI